MKKILLVFVAIALSGTIQSINAQTSFKSADEAVAEVENLVMTFGEAPEAEVISINSSLISIASLFVDEPEIELFMKVAKELVLVDLEDCGYGVQNHFTSQMKALIKSLGEFKLMEMRDDEDKIIIIGDQDLVRAMLVLSCDYEIALIKLSIAPEDLVALLEDDDDDDDYDDYDDYDY